jgi:hypothetical protein
MSVNIYRNFVHNYHMSHPELKGPDLFRAAGAEWRKMKGQYGSGVRGRAGQRKPTGGFSQYGGNYILKNAPNDLFNILPSDQYDKLSPAEKKAAAMEVKDDIRWATENEEQIPSDYWYIRKSNPPMQGLTLVDRTYGKRVNYELTYTRGAYNLWVDNYGRKYDDINQFIIINNIDRDKYFPLTGKLEYGLEW